MRFDCQLIDFNLDLTTAIAAVLYILNIGDCETCIMSWNGKPLNYIYSSGNCASFGI